ncbi:MAG: D-alanyl-D-alanine carboxypeptidase [Actinomycetota bacterium]|nr:D-alanyl-D-alanine carboxypeptidase [Actinomycetota bacterium]
MWEVKRAVTAFVALAVVATTLPHTRVARAATAPIERRAQDHATANRRPSPVATSARAPALGAAAGILVDGDDGQILWERQSRQRRAIASTTKILTALIVIEKASPRERVTASARAEAVGSNDALVTELELTRGESLTVEELLYGLLLISASDAAVALAEHVGGSVEGFARIMNDRARQIGVTDSHFVNADGLDAPNHYSTAYDLSLIARAAMRDPLFRRIVASKTHQIPWAGRPHPRILMNRNQLLGVLPGASGIKTGNTRAAGRSLVASVDRNGERRISVLLASPEPFSESASLLGYGFSAFRRHFIATRGRPWGQITYGDGTSANVVPRRDLTLLVPASAPAPPARYDPVARQIVVEIPTRLVVPADPRCGGPPCRLPVRPRGRLLGGFVFLFAPLLSLFR